MLCIPAAHRGWPQKTRDEQIPRIIGKAYDKYRRSAMLRYRHLKPRNAATIGIRRWLPTGHAKQTHKNTLGLIWIFFGEELNQTVSA
jgi:hypothetical protein